MDSAKEFYFLTELRYLTGTALWHAERIREVVHEWSSVQAELHAAAPKTRPRFSLKRPDDFFKALVDEENERTRIRQDQFNRSLTAQWEIFARVDAFLAVQGRIALILFPQQESKDAVRADRATQLRKVLDIDAAHPIAHKLLRNKWIHFDEVIDELPPRDVEPITPQRFIHARDVDHYKQNTLRLMVVDTLTVIYRGFGEFQLEDMFEASEDIQTRTSTAIDNWGKRWFAPLG